MYIYNTNNISCNHVFLRNMLMRYLLTAFLNSPVEEEVSISRQYTVHTISTMSANQTRLIKKRECHSNAVNA